MTPWHGHHGQSRPFPDNHNPWLVAVPQALNQWAEEQLDYCPSEQYPRTTRVGVRAQRICSTPPAQRTLTCGSSHPADPNRMPRQARWLPRTACTSTWAVTARRATCPHYPRGNIPPSGGHDVHPSGRPPGWRPLGAKRGSGVARAPTPTEPRGHAGDDVVSVHRGGITGAGPERMLGGRGGGRWASAARCAAQLYPTSGHKSARATHT